MGDPASPPAKSPSPEKSPASPAKFPASPAKSPASPAKSASSASDPNANLEYAPLVVDENPDTNDADLGIDVTAESDTTSLKSSILRYRVENGRTYHAYKDGSYVLPNDDAENDRLDLQHTLFLLSFDDKLYNVPIQGMPHRVLDAGCGTGIWSIDFADAHPDSHVTGIDLSPIQPPFVPPNAEFYVDDIEDDWNFSKPFDLVFARFMTGSIKDWPRFFRQSFQNLSPGGAIELQDIIYPILSDDGSLADHHSLKRWGDLLQGAFAGIGRPIDSALRYEEQLAEAGFVDICTVKEKWPTNRWPRDKKYKQIGIWNQENIIDALGALTLALFTRPKEEGGLGWSNVEVEVLLAGVRKDMRNTDIHAYFRIHAVYGRKP